MLRQYVRITALLLLFLVLLCCCGKNKDQKQEPVPDKGAEPEAQEPIVTYPLDDEDVVPKIVSQGQGYGDILRLKSTKEILFSPEITELRERIDSGKSVEDYSLGLVFVLLDENGKEYYAYPELRLPIHESKGTWFDVFLQSEDISCGFCPTVGRSYTIEVSIYDNDEKKIMEGVWQSIKASDSYADSPYYDPTHIPTEEDRKDMEYQVQYLPTKGGVLWGPSRQTLKHGQGSEKIMAVSEKGYMFVGWSDGYSLPERQGDTFVRSKVIYAEFAKIEQDGSLPNMYIKTETGEFITSKQEYQSATISIVGAAQDKYNITVTTKIRGRGNSSFSGTSDMNDYWGKNSYRLKLDEKANLLGVGGSANRDWVLNSNKHDASGLRNYTVWNLAEQMNTMPFVPGFTWVNVYLNGDYRGLYMLTDHVEVANDRVEVNDSLQQVDKGFLLELDFRGDGDEGAVKDFTYFYVDGFHSEWVIKSEVFDKSETAFIRNYISDCHGAIMSGKREVIDRLIDIPSLIDMFIIEELSKDVDAGGTSLFMQKDKGGKLYFTAPWDFDFGFGTYGPATYTHDFVCEGDNNHPWFTALLTQEWFLRALQARMAMVSEMLEITKQGLLHMEKLLAPAADHQDQRWNIYASHYHPYVSEAVSVELDSYEAHVRYICDWVDERWAWMTAEIDKRVSRLR